MVLAVVTIILSASQSFGWSSPGHMIIAAAGYQHLSPALQKRVQTILKSHPAFGMWAGMHHNSASTVDFYTYIVMRAGTWPDDIRGSKSEYEHSAWHFIDYPLRAPNFAPEPSPKDSVDILKAIDTCEKVIRSKTVSDKERAVSLSWLIHLVGDIHQPLHCATLVSPEFPQGDRGGNSFYVNIREPHGAPNAFAHLSLHQYWDRLLGDSINASMQLESAKRLSLDFMKSGLHELGTATTPRAWSLKSRSIAVARVYLKGALQSSVHADNTNELSAKYMTNAEEIAHRQAALAGWRLAGMIKKDVK